MCGDATSTGELEPSDVLKSPSASICPLLADTRAMHSCPTLMCVLVCVFSVIALPFSASSSPSYRLTYLDEDGEEVELESTADVLDALVQARRGSAILALFIRPPLCLARSSLLGEGEWERLDDANASANQNDAKQQSEEDSSSSDESSESESESESEDDGERDIDGGEAAAGALPIESPATPLQPVTVVRCEPLVDSAAAAVSPSPASPSSLPSVAAAAPVPIVYEVKSDDAPPAAAQSEAVPIAAAPVTAASAASPSSASWSLFNIFGRNGTPSSSSSSSSSVVAVAVPVAVPAKDASALVVAAGASQESALVDESQLGSPLPDSVASLDSGAFPSSLSSSAVSLAAPSQAGDSQSSSLMQLDLHQHQHQQQSRDSDNHLHLPDCPRGGNMWDSSEISYDVLSSVLTSMLARTEERLGLVLDDDSALASGHSHGLVRAPHQALLTALRGLRPESFAPVVHAFVEVCAKHVEEREAEERALEEARLAELVRELEARALEEEAARLAEAEAERARVVECARREAEEEAERQAELARLAAEEEAARRHRLSLQREEAAQARREALRQAEEAQMEHQAQLEIIALRTAQLRAELEAEQAEAEAAAHEEEAPHDAEEELEAAQAEDPADHAAVDDVAEPVVGYPIASRSPSPVSVQAVPIPVAMPLRPSAASSAQRFNAARSELVAMGFTDDALNTFVLQRTGLDIGAAVDWLMTDAATGGALKNEIMQQ